MRTARQLSIFLLLITGLVALYGGLQMISDPTGNSLGLPFYLLNGSVFSDYAVGGWILVPTVGILSSVTILCVLRRNRYYSFMIMLQGVIICVFVFMLMLLLGEAFGIEYVFLILGIGLIGLGALQNQRKIAVDSVRKVNPAPKSIHHKHRKHK